MYIDQAKIHVLAGNGGGGCASFYRNRRSRFGRPDGGNGGKGGNVIIIADENKSTLLDFRYRRHYRAGHGRGGSGNNKTGRHGSDCLVPVPCGTLIYDALGKKLIKDLTLAGEQVVVARGGRGGLGNQQAINARPGQPGEDKEILLELKLIADVGIIGYPNAGKSSLINCLTDAVSKAAPYIFTTKQPVLGIIRANAGGTIVIADIPGLIEGAHSGKGLGNRFLRHIERTSMLIHLVDMSLTDAGAPYKNYLGLNKELLLYQHALSKKPQIVVANKMDLEPAQINLGYFQSQVKKEVIAVSCLTKSGIPQLVDKLQEKYAGMSVSKYRKSRN